MYKRKLQSMTRDTSSQFKDALQFQRQIAGRHANGIWGRLGNEPIWRNTGDAAVEPSYMITGLNQTSGLNWAAEARYRNMKAPELSCKAKSKQMNVLP